MPEHIALEAIELAKSFGPTTALRGVDLRVGWDERVALLGGNGAGKTTLLRLAAGLLRPTTGELRLAGLPIAREGSAARRLVGFVGHQSLLYPDLTVEENLAFFARLYGVADAGRRVESLLDRLGVAARRRDRARALSRGLQQRVALARALLHDPPILLLDEPETGLDVPGRELLAEVVGAPGRTVLLSTHDRDLARRVAARAVVLAGGRVAEDVPTSTLGAALSLGRPA
jgi:heme exporter protein A